MENLKKLSLTDLDSLYSLSYKCENGQGDKNDFGLFKTTSYSTIRKMIVDEVNLRINDYINPSVKKPIKEKDSNIDLMEAIMKYFSQIRKEFKLGDRPLKLTYQRKRDIQSRLDEGYSLKDFEDVIKSRAIVWNLDEKMKQCIVPETLFRASNFPKYVEQSESILKSEKKDWTDSNNEKGKSSSELDWT